MAANKFLILEQFTFIVTPPDAHVSSLRASIYEDGRMILNGKFAAELNGKPVQIRLTDDAKHLCFIESDSDNTVIFPKNGSKRLPSAMEYLKKHQIALPARYEICYNEECRFWQGDYGENPPSAPIKPPAGSKRK